MTILALIGSPRRQGNTEVMADEVLRGASEAGADTSKIYVDDHWIRPIGDVCDVISKRDDPRSDDDFPALLERFLDADVVVWSTPVYWQGLSGQLKCFLDRMSSYFRRPSHAERFDGKGHIILCSFGRKDPVHGQWITNAMKLTVEVLRGRYLGDVCAAGTQKRGQVRDIPDVLSACYDLGREAAEQVL
ncbi:flavodoxin family protein [Candidatus Hydrogenedentota bacterium]